MKILSWNCRGIRKAPTVKRLKGLCLKYQPDLLFMQETKCNRNKMQRWTRLGLFDYSYCVDPDGSKGGLGVWWNKNMTVTVIHESKNWIHLKIKNITNQHFFFTGVCGAPVRSEREILWKYLSDLNIQTEPWLLAGDFNQVTSMNEKLSHCLIIPGSEALSETINNLGLIDIPTSGNWFTWTNGRHGDDLVWERLDKCIVNTNWLNHFPDSWVEALPVVTSDHSPLIIHSHKSIHTPFKNPFHFEAMWLQHPQLKEVVHSAWQQPVATFQRNIHHHVKNNEELIARKRLEFLLTCEEIKWAQHAKQLWLLQGDRNTKYFHSVVNHHRTKTRIHTIQSQHGQWITDPKDIQHAATNYFQNLYTSTAAEDDSVRRLFIENSGIPKLNQGHIQHLSAPFTCLEIETALFQLNGGKAPGPDGMTPLFFQHCWDTVQDDVISMIKGIKIARGAPSINHLMYADDILLFFKADKTTCVQVNKMLHQFGELAGLWMNPQKSEVKFSPNITEERGGVLTRLLNCRRVDHLGKYLGGFIDGHNTTKRNASLILDNLQQRLTGWKSRMLSQAARTTLIKAVVSATPIYHLQHTWLSHSQAAKCDGVMRKFFWSQWEDSKSPTMISWKKLCKGRKEEGLGFRQMLKLNEALLAKQVWRILTMEDTLVRWRVGNGHKIALNDVKWIHPDTSNHHYNKLCDLMFPGGFWDADKVAQVYNSPKKERILDTVISHTSVEDKLVWLKSDHGDFTVKKAYDILTNDPHPCVLPGFNRDRLWKLPLPQRILVFWWKTLHKGLPLKMNLARKGFQISTTCPFGCDMPEMEKHLFQECHFAKRVWSASRLHLIPGNTNTPSMIDWISNGIATLSKSSPPHQKDILILLISICWSLYTHRNKLLFQHDKDDVMECLNRAYQVVDALAGVDPTQGQDFFFKVGSPRLQRNTGRRRSEHLLGRMVLTCSWKLDLVTRRKAFAIFQHTP
ncbi:reverse transcriptase [Senna tora]|uniref:Reverse transcriptase n=1 Tax=Senna tora TaxID=362788 RepID=A0A834X6Y7_9FABA|nr:reverse transcriptase [Senna tora]